MGFIVFLVVVLIVVGYIFIQVKISNLKYRAKQHVLKDTGLSASSLNKKFNSSLEKKKLEKFLSEHPNYTEEILKNKLQQYASELFNKNLISEFNENLYSKIQKDNKLEKFKTTTYQYASILRYDGEKLNAIMVYSDGRDEHNTTLYCILNGDEIQLDNYMISKGNEIGF